jgi:hypothetical protein
MVRIVGDATGFIATGVAIGVADTLVNVGNQRR